MNLAGGLVYHARALVYRKWLWSGFREELVEILQEKLKGSQHVFLIGPSAAYNLTDSFFLGKKQVWFSEPDTLARHLLERRLARLGVRHEHLSQDFLEPRQGLSRLRQWWTAHPDVAVVFSNVLGQLPFVFDEFRDPKALSEYWPALQDTLQGRTWLSYHDRLSFSGRANHPRSGFTLTSAQSPASLLRRCGAHWKLQIDGEVIDHGTGDFFSERPRRILLWPLAPGRCQIVEVLLS